MFKKKSSKFRVCSCYKSIDFEFQNSFSPEKINVKWSQNKIYSDSLKYGDPPIWNKSGEGDNGYIAGRCHFKNQIDPEMQVILYKAKKGTGFQTKVYRYSIESVKENGSVVTLANADIDFTTYADINGSTKYLTIELKPKQKFVLNATLKLILTFELIETADFSDLNGYSSTTISGNELTIENLFSLAYHIQYYRDNVISPGASTDVFIKPLTNCPGASTDVFKPLTNCKLIILVFDARWMEKSPNIVQALNSFYCQAKMHFVTSVEMFYVSMDKDENALLETIEENYLKCPAIKPQGQLSKAITQHYEITKAPHMLVLSDSRVVCEISGDVEIVRTLAGKKVKKVIEKWMKLISKMDTNFSFSTWEVLSKDDSKVEGSTSEILIEKDEVIHKQECKNLRLNYMSARHEEKERKFSKESRLLEAERDIRCNLKKRGIRGPTGHLWRVRFFHYEDQKLIYTDPKTNETRGSISVPEITSIGSLPNLQQDKDNASFSITVPGRVYEMQARDQLHMISWIAAVRYLMEQPMKRTSV